MKEITERSIKNRYIDVLVWKYIEKGYFGLSRLLKMCANNGVNKACIKNTSTII